MRAFDANIVFVDECPSGCTSNVNIHNYVYVLTILHNRC